MSKKGFILYDDSLQVFQELCNEDAGELIKHLLEYSNYINSEKQNEAKKPNALLGLMSVLASTFKSQMERDLDKWKDIKEKRSEAGKKGGRPKGKKQKKAKKAVTVTVTDTVTVNAKEIYSIYPKKIGGAKAIESIEKALTKVSFEILKEKVTRFAQSQRDVEKQYIPHPTTWFNQERWMDVEEEKREFYNFG